MHYQECVRLNIGFPVVRTDGRAVYGHVITKFSQMGRLSKLRVPLACRAPL